MPVDADLGRYRLISKVGSGGMATVDLAEDTRLGRLVALKRMAGTDDVSGLSRLRREALAGASLNHPNLVSVYDILTLEDGELVIVMEYVQGETLRERLTRMGALAPSDALPLLAGAAAGLDAIHGVGIVHRDVKPSNILLGEDGAVKVADLGVASVPDRTRITTSGSIIGSLNYMAPEQLDSGPVTPAIDIYALAAVAFEVLSGVKARDAPNPVALAHAISTRSPPSLSEAWPAAPRAATDVLRRGMSREPRDRPRSAGELVAKLEAGLAAPARARPARAVPAGARPARAAATGARPAPAAPRASPPRNQGERRPPADRDARSRPWILAALALGLVCLAVGLVVAFSQGGSPSQRTAKSGQKSRASTSASHSASTPQAAQSRSTSAKAAPPASSTSAAAPSSSSSTSAAGASSASSTSAAGASGPASASSPVSAVESFYRLAAAHRYPEAWALADPAFRTQVGGYRSFQAGQANDRSITFDSAHVSSQTGTASTVSVKTTSVQSTGTRHCAGTVNLVPGAGGRWMLHQININCT